MPALDPRPVLTMADMGHGGHEMSHAGHETAASAAVPDPHAGHVMPGMPDMPAGDTHAGQTMTPGTRAAAAPQTHPASEQGNPLVDMQTNAPTSKLDDPGIGLRGNGRRVLTYADLRSTFAPPTAGSRPGRSNCT